MATLFLGGLVAALAVTWWRFGENQSASAKAALETLSPRQRRVIALRFGLSGDQLRTIEEVAKRMGVSREEVRRLERSALAQLREGQRS